MTEKASGLMAREIRLIQPYFTNRKIRRQVFKEAQRDFRPAIQARTNAILRDRLIQYNNALTVKEMRARYAKETAEAVAE